MSDSEGTGSGSEQHVLPDEEEEYQESDREQEPDQDQDDDEEAPAGGGAKKEDLHALFGDSESEDEDSGARPSSRRDEDFKPDDDDSDDAGLTEQEKRMKKLKAMIQNMPDKRKEADQKKQRKRRSQADEEDGDKPKRKRKKSEGGEKKEKARRKKKEAEPEEGRSRRRRREEGNSGAEGGEGVGGNASDPDNDSLTGAFSEAEEDNSSKNDLDIVLENIKQSRRRKSNKTSQEIKDSVIAFLGRMEDASDADIKANKERRPALAKLKMLDEAVTQLVKRPLRATLMDCHVLVVISKWLEPLPDGSLPNINVRTAMLDVLARLNLGADDLEALARSNLGKLVMRLAKYTENETEQNKRTSRLLIDTWSRPIFNLSTSYRDLKDHEAELAERRPRMQTNNQPEPKQADTQKKAKPGDPDFIPHARIPYRMEYTFLRRPDSVIDASSLPQTSSHADPKTGTKAKLGKALINMQKTINRNRPLKISIEGRNMHKS